MKKRYPFLLLLALTFFSAKAQLPQLPDLSSLGIPLDSTQIISGILTPNPTGERYKDPIFSNVLFTTGILYGIAPAQFDSLQTPIPAFPLALDVYQPLGDLLNPKPRPVIVLAFGGAFVFGARVSPDIIQLCTRFAQLGYVTISIDYRLSDELILNPEPVNALRAVGKAMHDMRAAVRFLRMQDEVLANVLNIDTDQIYVGGVSAGGFAALHTAYLDRIEELPTEFVEPLMAMGGIEGNSGNAGYSSEVAGCINLCGALGKKEWLEVGDVPLVSMHGDQDGTVPYDSDTIRVLDINYPVDGSAAIRRRAEEVGVRNAFYPFVGADHTPFVLPALITPSEMAYMDTTFEFVRDFMFGVVTGSSGVGVSENAIDFNYSLSPNPVNSMLHIELDSEVNSSVQILSIEGKEMFSSSFNTTLDVDVSTFPKSNYVLRIENDNGVATKQFIVK